MEIKESQQYPSLDFCNAKKAEFTAWAEAGGIGPNPLNAFPELKTDFVFVPKPAESEPEPEDLTAKRIAEIKSELATIDQKSIRPLREGDTVRVAQYEAEAQLLREELATLEG